MAELSESQLLLLDNLMYYSGSSKCGKSVEQIATEMLEAAESGQAAPGTFSGGFESNLDEAKAIAEAILSDDTLCGLRTDSSMNTEGVRAACFVDAQGNATIAVRGTGGYYDAWTDNFYGLYESDTPVQKEFAEWVKAQAEDYSNITITGHSKGGNLAQYATIVCGDAIDRCVSYDGQGFGKDFHEKYADEIAANRGKITSICADNDYVNVLLYPVAGTIEYLKVSVRNPKDYHSSFELWYQNRGNTDNGNYTNFVDQGFFGAAMNGIADALAWIIGVLPPCFGKALTNLIAGEIAILMSKQTRTDRDLASLGFNTAIYLLTELYEKIKYLLPKEIRTRIEEELKRLNELAEQFSHASPDEDDYQSSRGLASTAQFAVDTQKLKDSAQELTGMITDMNAIQQVLASTKIDGTLGLFYNNRIQKSAGELEKLAEIMSSLRKALDTIAELYENTENSIAASV